MITNGSINIGAVDDSGAILGFGPFPTAGVYSAPIIGTNVPTGTDGSGTDATITLNPDAWVQIS
jgi:hypothetical protein